MDSNNTKYRNVLLVSEYFHPHWTSLAKSLLNLAVSLTKEGRRVDVLTTRFLSELPKTESYKNITIYRSAALFKISRTHYSLSLIFDFYRLVKNYDLVIVNSPLSNILFVSLLTKLFRKKLCVLHQGDLILPKKTGSPIFGFIIEKIFDLCTICSMQLADFVSTYTEDYAKNSRVLKYFIKKLRPVIPPLQLSSNPPSPEFVSLIKSIAERRILVGFAGRFVEEKGFDILLQAIPSVAEKMPQVKFVFAGEANVAYEKFYEYNSDLINKNKEYVEILGLLNDENLAFFYSTLSAFVISSRSDCFALTQIEAVLSNVPIIVTDIPGARMLVRSSGYGEIARPEDPHSLAEAILKILTKHQDYSSYQVEAVKYLKRYERLELN